MEIAKGYRSAACGGVSDENPTNDQLGGARRGRGRGVSGSGSSQPALVWVRDDGTPAERAELLAARDACMERVNASKTPFTRRWGHVEYAGQVIDCIKTQGYHLVDAPEE